jgi:hypothetical protein
LGGIPAQFNREATVGVLAQRIAPGNDAAVAVVVDGEAAGDPGRAGPHPRPFSRAREKGDRACRRRLHRNGRLYRRGRRYCPFPALREKEGDEGPRWRNERPGRQQEARQRREVGLEPARQGQQDREREGQAGAGARSAQGVG